MGKVNKHDVIEVLEEISTLLEMKDENVFKIRAFANAARTLESDPRDLKALVETEELEKLKGIGKGISYIIHELYKKGKSKDHLDLRKGFPDSLFELFKIQGLGAKRIKILFKKLGIKSVGELEYACKENRLLDLDGFGIKSQENVLKGIEQLKKSAGHYLISTAKANAELFLKYLKKQKGILKIEIAGSIRRHKEVIKDIDILISAKNTKRIHEAFVKYSQVDSVIAHGETKSSVALKSGMNCDLRTVSLEEYPAALYYFTGSKEHNVAVRTLAKRKGFKINEYGVFKGKKRIPCRETIGLRYIPPEARENSGEVEWALKRDFPKLVEQSDIRGIFHVHSNYSDEKYIERAEIIREKGTDRAKQARGKVAKYTWHEVGSSYLPSDVLAAFLYAQLEAVDVITQKRKKIYDTYFDAFRSLEKEGKVQLPFIPVDCIPNYHLFYLMLDSERERDRLSKYLNDRGVVSVFHFLPLHTSPMGLKLGYRKGDLPVTEKISDGLLRLPFYNDMTAEEQDYVIQSVKQYF